MAKGRKGNGGFSLGVGNAREGRGGTAADKLQRLENKEEYNFKFVPYEQIRPSKMNEYDIKDIDALADDIEMHGLYENLVLAGPDENGMYELLAGERRYTAIGVVREKRGKRIFEKGVPSRVINPDMDEVDREIVLHEANRQKRNESMREKIYQTERLYELYQKKKKRGDKIVGSITENIAASMEITQRQVQKMMAVNKKLEPGLKELLDEGGITLEDASKYAQLGKESQGLVLESLQKGKNVSEEDYQAIKERDKTQREAKKGIKSEIGEYQDHLVKVEKRLEEIRNEMKKAVSPEKKESLQREEKDSENERKKYEAKLKAAINRVGRLQIEAVEKERAPEEELEEKKKAILIEKSLQAIAKQLAVLSSNVDGAKSDERAANIMGMVEKVKEGVESLIAAIGKG